MPGSDAIDDPEARAHHVWSAQIGTYRGIENSFPASYRIAEHEHAAATVYLVLRGGHTEVARNGRVECATGTVVFSPPGARHADHYGPRGGEAFLVAVPESLLLRGREAGIRLEQTVHTTAPNPRRILREIRSEMRSADAVSHLAVEALLLHILAALHREDALPGNPPRWLRRVHELLSEETADDLSVTRLAEVAGIHPVYLTATFRRFFGVSISAYARQRRAERARHLLATSRLPLAEVALACGYADQSHFSRAFKSAFGITPAAYRRGRAC